MRPLLWLLLLLQQRHGIFVAAWSSSTTAMMTTTTRNKHFQNMETTTTRTTTTALSLARFSLSNHHSLSITEKRRILSRPPPPPSTTAPLYMGLFDSFFSSFLENREGDFIQLDKSSTEAFGPGPLLILHNVPTGIQVEEVLDMIHDGAPSAHAQGCTVVRLDELNEDADEYDSNTKDEDIWNIPLEQALQKLLARGNSATVDTLASLESAASFKPSALRETSISIATTSTPVLFFSGFCNAEMMNVYNILGPEIFQEMLATSSSSSTPTLLPPPPAACAKAVPKAMNKPLRQVLEEISGDHQDSIAKTNSDDGYQ